MSDVVIADVCVVGSGAGGAVAAAELAEGGLRVVVLEEGPARGLGDATGRPRDTLPRLYRDGGQVAAIGRPPLLLPLGRGTGGTTFVNSGTCFRTPPHVLDRWRAEHGIDGLTDAVFERVEAALGVAEVPPELAGRNAATIRHGAEALGWRGGYLRRNARGCRGSGVCAFGCPTGAKQHAGEVYLPRALAAGARLVTGARAERILHRGGRATGVEAALGPAGPAGTTVAGPGRLTVRAGAVVVAAGAIHTPLLLARSGLGRTPALGRHLTVHPATAVWGVFDELVDMSRGVPQSYYVDEFAGEGFVFEGIAGPPDYLALAAPFSGDRLRELMLGHRHVAQCGLMVSDTSRGRVASVLGRPLVRYDLGERDARTFHRALLRLTELMWAAGARRVILPVARVPELRAGDSSPLERLDLGARDLKLMGFHPLGTARAHRDPGRGVVDGDLAVHGVRGVHVADGAAVPGPLGVNPQITIMALATRLAHHLLEGSAGPAARVPSRVLAHAAARGAGMSFLIDPPWLYAGGRAYARLAPERAQGHAAAVAGAATMAVFWGVSVSLYLNRPWTGRIWRLCRARDGRDWMLNSGVLRIDERAAGPGTHAVSAALFASYPYWLWRGWRDGRRRA